MDVDQNLTVSSIGSSIPKRIVQAGNASFEYLGIVNTNHLEQEIFSGFL